ncbi:MAG TPA: gamma-glutamyl-gamma-aminobutyrate hydrolase family protein [Terriglobia bacterium]|nr:gamma-glutamyl-gamma-aminobutyrate hydrolase family protein [Terriglobia bacterium]
MKIALSVSEKEKAKGAESPYFKAMLAAGAKAEELSLISAADARRVRADDFDGVLFAGGEDVDPGFYGEEKKYDSVHVNRARDEFEFKLLDRFMDRRLPVFGICRGTQVINVKFGGTLYQDLASEATTESQHKQSGSRSATTHQITLTDPESRLGGAFEGSCRVNSLHHQAIKRLGHGLKVTAHSEDGLVEAVEAAGDYPFLLAVQWHPEELVAEHEEQRRLLAQFVAQCRERSQKSEIRSQKTE